MIHGVQMVQQDLVLDSLLSYLLIYDTISLLLSALDGIRDTHRRRWALRRIWGERTVG